MGGCQGLIGERSLVSPLDENLMVAKLNKNDV